MLAAGTGRDEGTVHDCVAIATGGGTMTVGGLSGEGMASGGGTTGAGDATGLAAGGKVHGVVASGAAAKFIAPPAPYSALAADMGDDDDSEALLYVWCWWVCISHGRAVGIVALLPGAAMVLVD